MVVLERLPGRADVCPGGWTRVGLKLAQTVERVTLESSKRV